MPTQSPFPTTFLARLIKVTDGLFLMSLLVMAFCWWEVNSVVMVFGHPVPVRWRDTLFLPPVLLLIVRVVAASVSEALDRDARLGLFRCRGVARGVMIFVSIMAPIMLADALLKRTKIDIHVAPIVLDNRGEKEYFGRTKEMLKDPDLVWTFIPGSSVYGRPINRLGFRDREVEAVKAPGVRRVICLGDSVTAQGQPGYSQYLHELLTNAPPDGGQWEAFNMGVYGYTAMQGLRLFQLRVRELKPDVVTVSYGRNDHTYLENADRERMAVNLSPFAKRVYSVLTRRTVGRLVLCLMDRQHLWAQTKGRKAGERVVRVTPEEYRNTLCEFVKEIRAIGALPILMTAPRCSKVPEDYVNNNQAHSTDEYKRDHDRYCEIVREVCRETGATLLDMQKIMTGPEWDTHFAHDAIHFDFYEREGHMTCGSENQPGLRYFARQVYAAIKQLPPLTSSK